MEKSNQSFDGLSRFILQLDHLSPLLSAASQSANPALSLFLSPARRYVFYLEALTRIYRKIHDKTKFNDLRKEFKLLEDQLGRVDFYNAYCDSFSKLENFPSQLIAYFESQKNTELIALQLLLDEKKWTTHDGGLVQQIIKELEKIQWQEAAQDRLAIVNFLKEELDDFDKDYKKEKFDFSLLEQGVHEFRRQLRWFSIYAQALDGLIQLENNAARAEEIKKYLTPDILNSPYNKMPASKNNLPAIQISAPDFYAISWVINEIGNLKDEGLSIHSLTESIIATGMKSNTDAESLALSLLNKKAQQLNDVSKQAREIADELMKRNEVVKQLIRFEV